MSRSAVVYARVSVASEESVSVARQVATGRRYAEARGWTVVGVFVDDGVSATYNKPHERPGWRALMASEDWFDAVVIWKVDRLARRVIDFLHVDETLQTRGAAIVCVEQHLDMTTGEGRAFAQMLAVFGELESAAISSRIAAARTHLIQSGRVAGGQPPYGWRSVTNPAGPGLVLATDPERFGWVQAMAKRALRGDTIASMLRWLDSEGAPLPRGWQGKRTTGRWQHSSVQRILRNPLLAGMILHNPGNRERGRTLDVLRDADGHPIIKADLAAISVTERNQILATLDARSARYDSARRLRDTTTPIVLGLAVCGACPRELPMRQGTREGRLFLKCPNCRQVIAVETLSRYLERRLLLERGDVPVHQLVPSPAADPVAAHKLALIEAELARAALSMTLDNADIDTIAGRVAELKRNRTRQRRAAAAPAEAVPVPLGLTVANLWRRCVDDRQRRQVLESQVETLVIFRGGSGRFIDPGRVDLTWRAATRCLAPDGIADNVEQPSVEVEWVSFKDAAALLGCEPKVIARAVRENRIVQRQTTRQTSPSLLRTSVLALGETLNTPGTG